MAYVSETLDWGSAEDRRDLRRYLSILPEDTSEDTLLEVWYREAIRIADEWLANPFTDDDGLDVDLPEGVRVGIWEYCKAKRERYGQLAGAKSVKTGQLSETYGDGGVSGQSALACAISHWRPYKLELLMLGASG